MEVDIIAKNYLYPVIITVILGVLISCSDSPETTSQAEKEVYETASGQIIPQRPEPPAEKEPDTVENFAYYLDERIPGDIQEIILDNRRHTFINIDMDIEEHPEKYLMLDYDEEVDRSIVKLLEEAVSIPASAPYIPLESIEKELDFLMDYLKYYYGAYAYYGGDEVFHTIKEEILSELGGKDTEAITSGEYSYVLYNHLSNRITDCHFRIGGRSFSDTQGHKYFLRNTEYPFYKEDDIFFTEIDAKAYELISVRGLAPSEMLVPYLNEEGYMTWIIGYPSTNSLNETIAIELYHEPLGEMLELELSLSHKYATASYSNLMYNEYTAEDVQIVESRRCAPLSSEENMDTLFAESAEQLRDRNLIVVDLRDNTGGNSKYANIWLSSLLDREAGSMHGIFSSRRTRTVHYIQPYETGITPEEYIYNTGEYFGWSGPFYEFGSLPFENKDRLFIVLINANTASAGENFADILRQTENTIIIGTNSAGAYATGNINSISLPYSKVTLKCGFNLHINPDLTSIEGMGIMPDIWAESNDALDRTLKFITNYGLAE